MAETESDFKYLLRVIPESHEVGDALSVVPANPGGWELVSSRWDEGTELLVFRRPA